MSTPSDKPEPVFDDAIDAKLRQERQEAEQREAARLKFRETFPKVTEFADECRKYFGDGVEVVYAIEDGKYVGRVPKEVLKEHEERQGSPLQPVRLFDTGNQNRNRPAPRPSPPEASVSILRLSPNSLYRCGPVKRR